MGIGRRRFSDSFFCIFGRLKSELLLFFKDICIQPNILASFDGLALLLACILHEHDVLMMSRDSMV